MTIRNWQHPPKARRQTWSSDDPRCRRLVSALKLLTTRRLDTDKRKADVENERETIINRMKRYG